MMGLPFDSGAVRVRRLEEALHIIKPLLRGEKVDFTGKHYTVENGKIAPASVQAPPPILIAANQPRLLKLAPREAEMSLAINLNLMAVAGRLPRHVEAGLGADGARRLAESDAIPVLKGSTDEMCERLLGLRERLSISYILVADQIMDALAPVVARLAGR